MAIGGLSADDPRIRAAREKWRYTGATRPEFAVPPDSGQRSVWDFPRPPAIERVSERVRVLANEVVIADSTRVLRVCETAGAPTYYLPPEDVEVQALVVQPPASVCEWKGVAELVDLKQREESVAIPGVGWRYPEPFEEFSSIAGWYAFYPNRVACWVGDDRARPQPGGYYGGWVTSDLVGPIKGEPGSETW